MRDRVWVCRDGRKLLVSQMTDGHIANPIAKIRRDNWRTEYLERLLIEQVVRSLNK